MNFCWFVRRVYMNCSWIANLWGDYWTKFQCRRARSKKFLCVWCVTGSAIYAFRTLIFPNFCQPLPKPKSLSPSISLPYTLYLVLLTNPIPYSLREEIGKNRENFRFGKKWPGLRASYSALNYQYEKHWHQSPSQNKNH